MDHLLAKKTVPEEPYPLEEKPIVIVDEIITSKHDGKTKIAICKHEIRVTEEVIKKGKRVVEERTIVDWKCSFSEEAWVELKPFPKEGAQLRVWDFERKRPCPEGKHSGLRAMRAIYNVGF